MSLPRWTHDQVAALAPDPASLKAGQGLAGPRKWGVLGRDARSLWGECQGSGSKPYQVAVDAAEPAFRCTCPSRKFPCKHALGLLFLYSADPAGVGEAEAPAWVAEWLAGRESRAEKRAVRPAAEATPDPAAQARRAAEREARTRAGLDDLEQWLHDLVRQGLAAAQGKPRTFWEGPAARLVDAQAPGAARWVRELAALPGTDDWPARLLERLARLHLLVEAFRRVDALSEDAAADVRAAVGWTARQEEVRAGPAVHDRWVVLGARTAEEDRLRVRRTWLRGEDTGRTALLLAFAAGGQPLEPGPAPGTRLAASLAFFPGAHPVRALVAERTGDPQPVAAIPGHASLHGALGDWAAALARNPWTEQLTLPLRGVVPVREGARWLLRDADGAGLPLAPAADDAAWTLLALGGDGPVDVACEWDGAALLPLAAVAEGRFHVLGTS